MSTPVGVLGRFRRHSIEPAAGPARRTALDCRTELAGVLSMYGWGIRGAVVVGGLALLFTMVNVQVFGSAGHQPGTGMASTFLWAIAWLLDPMASVGLGVAIGFEGLLARYGRHEAWLTGVKWFAGVMTWTMNIWPAIDVPHPSGLAAGVVLHSLAPGLVLGLAEAAPRVRRKVAEITAELEREAQSFEAQETERHATQHQAAAERHIPPSAPIPPPAPALRAFPTRPDFAPAVRLTDDPPDRPADRLAGSPQVAPQSQPEPPTRAEPATRPAPASAQRSGAAPRDAPAGRQRTGKPRTDAELSQAVREIAELNGAAPSQYQLKRALGVGSGRAARLLAELNTTAAGPPASNGAATRKGDPQ